ncbi:MAG: hypothetical protein QXH39_05560 [Conexivisphaerales archaeon]
MSNPKKGLEGFGEAMEMLSSLAHEAVSVIQIEQAILFKVGSSFS